MDLNIPLRIYEGETLLKLSEGKMDPIVQDFLFPGDYVLLVAKEKLGKSLLGLQLSCAISSGTPFLDTLEVPQAYRIWYISAEGKDDETKLRLLYMSKKVALNAENFKLICIEGLRLNTQEGLDGLNYLVKTSRNRLPKVIIIDPLYMAMKGSIKDDETVKEFTFVARRFAKVCDAALVIIHHSRRPIRLQNGSLSNLGDEEIYGSAFLKASVDHIFYMGKVDYTDHIFLKCDTQRTGQIIDKIELKLHQPDPLYFAITDSVAGWGDKIATLLKDHPKGLTMEQMVKLLNISRVTLYHGINQNKKIKKTSTRPVLFHL